MYWGVVNPVFAVLPQMRERHHGAIAVVTSIGGKVSVPHLLPYSGAKFAAVGLTEGLHATDSAVTALGRRAAGRQRQEQPSTGR